MVSALREIFVENWRWRHTTWHLAVADFRSAYRGAILGWVWMVLQPSVFIFCFWFAIGVGLRHGSSSDGVPFVLWLAAGQIPWVYMGAMIGNGTNAFRGHTYLVTTIRFPLVVIPSVTSLTTFLRMVVASPIVVILMLAFRVPPTIYLLQIPVAAFAMYALFTVWSIAMSPLTAMSRDLFQLVKVVQTPLFWLSGVIFDIDNISTAWLRALLEANPVTFFVKAFRAAITDHYWIWEHPRPAIICGVEFLLLLLAAGWINKRLGKVVSDVF